MIVMAALLHIKLEDVKFYAYHGLYPEERKAGGEYRVSVSVSYSPPDEPVTDLTQTIDYGIIYRLIKAQMDHPCDLIETLAMRMALALQQSIACHSIRVEIKKMRVPIEGFNGNTAVVYEWQR